MDSFYDYLSRNGDINFDPPYAKDNYAYFLQTIKDRQEFLENARDNANTERVRLIYNCKAESMLEQLTACWHCMFSEEKSQILQFYNEDENFKDSLSVLPHLVSQITSVHNVPYASLTTMTARLDYGAYWKSRAIEDAGRLRAKSIEIRQPSSRDDLIDKDFSLLMLDRWIDHIDEVPVRISRTSISLRRRVNAEVTSVFYKIFPESGIRRKIVGFVFAGVM